MALPLPKIIPDREAGGGVVTAMKGINSLSNDMLGNVIQGVKAEYAPLTVQAEAASKLAYANLMGPQFLAKLMGNKDILANMQNPQQNLNVLQQAAMGGGTGMNAFNNMPQPAARHSLSGFFGDMLKNVFGGGGGQGQPPSSQNSLQNPYQQGYAQQPQPQQPLPANYAQPVPVSEVGGPAPQTDNSFAENTGRYEGIEKEGAKAGEIRAQDIKDLNDVVFDADTKLTTLNDINSMISSPEMRQIRELPLAGRHEMAFYAKEGTPAQQQMVGRLYAQMGNVVKDSSRDFAGQFRKGEQQLLQGMKPNDSDTIDTMIGKAESLTTMTKLLRERSALTAKYMNQYHINKGQAAEMADKQLNANAIRQSIHEKLNPTVTIRNRRTGEVMTVPSHEARTKYGVRHNG